MIIVYVVWETEEYQETRLDKIFNTLEDAHKYIKNRDKMTGCMYTITEHIVD